MNHHFARDRLALPAGWQFSSEVLESPLLVPTVDGTAEMLTDDFSNTYQLIP